MVLESSLGMKTALSRLKTSLKLMWFFLLNVILRNGNKHEDERIRSMLDYISIPWLD